MSSVFEFPSSLTLHTLKILPTNSYPHYVAPYSSRFATRAVQHFVTSACYTAHLDSTVTQLKPEYSLSVSSVTKGVEGLQNQCKEDGRAKKRTNPVDFMDSLVNRHEIEM